MRKPFVLPKSIIEDNEMAIAQAMSTGNYRTVYLLVHALIESLLRVFLAIRNYEHPKGIWVTISGKVGDDAKPYQEKEVKRRIEESQR